MLELDDLLSMIDYPFAGLCSLLICIVMLVVWIIVNNECGKLKQDNLYLIERDVGPDEIANELKQTDDINMWCTDCINAISVNTFQQFIHEEKKYILELYKQIKTLYPKLKCRMTYVESVDGRYVVEINNLTYTWYSSTYYE